MTMTLTTCTLLLVIAGTSAARETTPVAKEQDAEEQEEFVDPGGMYGEYESSREASGTSWQPDSTPLEALHLTKGEWNFALNGFVNAAFNNDPDPRGDSGGFSTNAFMFKALRPTVDGTLGIRFMMSLEPTLGSDGYSMLLQTGQTADGVNPLFDRQYPHDLFVELAVTYTLPITDSNSLFIYFAPVGEPALGPVASTHRLSGSANPRPPLAHQWLDATHLTHGVLTFGLVFSDKAKAEASFFRGQQPDENRWGLEAPGFDSYSGRFTYNPTRDLSLQVSLAKLDGPELVNPDVGMSRFTASATYNRPLTNGNWQTTVAWGLNQRDERMLTTEPETTLDIPSTSQNAFLLESAVQVRSYHTLFGRYELVEKDGLFASNDPRTAEIFNVSTLNGGYLYDLPFEGPVGIGVGFSASIHFVPDALDAVYEGKSLGSFMVFSRFRIR